MIDINTSTTQELEEELGKLYEQFEIVKGECFEKYLEMSRLQTEYGKVDAEIKKRKGESHG